MDIGIIMAAGSGERLFSSLGMKKQFYPFIDKKEMFLSSIYAFIDSGIDRIYLVISSEDKDKFISILKREDLCNKVILVEGSSSREKSVRNAIERIKSDYSSSIYKDIYVYIHDGDRPFITSDFILRLKEESKGQVGLVPYSKNNSSLFDIKTKQYVNRDDYVQIQTPQVFRFDALVDSFNKIKGKEDSFFDEGSILLSCSYDVRFTDGVSTNIKISDEKSLAYGLYYISKDKQI